MRDRLLSIAQWLAPAIAVIFGGVLLEGHALSGYRFKGAWGTAILLVFFVALVVAIAVLCLPPVSRHIRPRRKLALESGDAPEFEHFSLETRRKLVRVHNGSAQDVKGCRVAIKNLSPHLSQDRLPHPLRWNHNDEFTCEIAPGGDAYAILLEASISPDGRATFLNPTSLVFAEEAKCTVTAWGDGASGSGSFLITDPRFENHAFPQIVPI